MGKIGYSGITPSSDDGGKGGSDKVPKGKDTAGREFKENKNSGRRASKRGHEAIKTSQEDQVEGPIRQKKGQNPRKVAGLF